MRGRIVARPHVKDGKPVMKRGKPVVSYRVIVDVGTDPVTGKRKQQTETFRVKEDAERRLAELIDSANKGTFVKPTKRTVADYMRQWLADYAKVNTRARTWENYSSQMNRHIIPAIGHYSLAGLRPDHLANLYRSMLDAGASPSLIGHIHRLISNALGQAVRWQLVPRNVAQAVTPPRARKAETTALEPTDLRRLLEAFQATPYHALLHLAAFSGARRSEILGLRWQDVDLDRGTIRIVQTLHQLVDGTLVFEEPKTQSGRRTIPLPTSAVLALKAHLERVEAEQAKGKAVVSPSALVFAKPDGSPLKPATVSQAFRRIVNGTPSKATKRKPSKPPKHEGLGLKVRFHDLRHTHASVLLLAGVHPKAVQERLGHANIGITLDTYSHLLPGVSEATADRFEDAMRDQREAAEARP